MDRSNVERAAKYPESYCEADHARALGRLAADIAKAGHTPGEWSVQSQGADYWVDSPCEGPKYRQDICRLSWGNPESKANAHLIASAPDLLSELVALVEQYEAWRDLGDGAAEPPDTDSARAAIAKAQGGAA